MQGVNKMSRVELINIFEDTLSMCHTNQRLINSINYSRQHNRVVTDENAAQYLKSLPHGTGKKAEVIVSKKRSFEAASAYKGKCVCVLNFFLATMRIPVWNMLSASGLFKRDKSWWWCEKRFQCAGRMSVPNKYVI